MRAAVLTEDHTFVVDTLPDPVPRSGELVLTVRSCGICGSDLKSYVHADPARSSAMSSAGRLLPSAPI